MKKIAYTLLLIFGFKNLSAQDRIFYDKVNSITLLPSGIEVNNQNTANNNFYLGKEAFNNRLGQQNTIIGIQTLDSGNVSQNTIVGNLTARNSKNTLNTVVGSYSFPNYDRGITLTSVGALNSFAGTSNFSSPTLNPLSFITNIGAANIIQDSASLGTTLIGSEIGTSLRSSTASVLIGYQAAKNQKKIINSILIGHKAGFSYLGENQSTNYFIGDEVGSRSVYSALNTMLGYRAQYGNNANTESNLGIGYRVFYNHLEGDNNTAIGEDGLYNFKSGTFNIGVGNYALARLDTGNYNIGIGAYSGSLFFIGSGDNYLGLRKGDHNIAIGHYTLLSTERTSNSVAIGYGALSSMNTEQYQNMAIGYIAGQNFQNGTRTVMIGNLAGGTLGNTINNSVAIGNGVKVNAHNQIFLGNSSVNTVRIFSNWTNYSDKRLKKNISYYEGLGLNFVNDLKPVFYNYKSHSAKDLQIGFIANDVEDQLNNLGQSFSGLTYISDTKALNYDTFVIPLINAVKELDQKIPSVNNESTNNIYQDVLNQLVKKQ